MKTNHRNNIRITKEEHKKLHRYEQIILKFDKWLNEEPDPETVRQIQRYWRDLKRERISFHLLNNKEK